METRHMGLKKNFWYLDVTCYYELVLFLLFIISYTIIEIKSFIGALIINPISNAILNTTYFLMPSTIELIVTVIFIVILIFFRKSYYYDTVKYNMQKGYNLIINPNSIELLVKNEDSVVIDIDEIHSINISFYSSPFENFYKLICSMSAFYKLDSNFAKSVIIIEVILKDEIDLNKFERKGLYYRLFNYRVNKKTNQAKLYLYEITYEKLYEQDMVVFYEYFGNLTQTDSIR